MSESGASAGKGSLVDTAVAVLLGAACTGVVPSVVFLQATDCPAYTSELPATVA